MGQENIDASQALEDRDDGLFIVFEGIDGCGKTTHVRLLEDRLSADVLTIREPGGTKVSEAVRNILLPPDYSAMENETELLLFLSARVELIKKKIRPALESGQTIIADRFGLSTIAYQFYGSDYQYPDGFENLARQVEAICLPDLYLLLDVGPKVGLERTGGRDGDQNRFDAREFEFHRRVRSGYLAESEARDNVAVVDGERSKQRVAHSVAEEIQKLLLQN